MQLYIFLPPVLFLFLNFIIFIICKKYMYKKQFERFSRRAYYICSFILIYGLIFLNYQRIINYILLLDVSEYTHIIFVTIIAGGLIFIFIWDIMVINNSKLNKLKVSGVEIQGTELAIAETVKAAEKVVIFKEFMIFQREILKSFTEVLYESNVSFQEILLKMYKDFFSEYLQFRAEKIENDSNSELEIYEYSDQGFENLIKDYKIFGKGIEGNIRYSLDKYLICFPNYINDSYKYLLIKIVTSVVEDMDLLVLIKGNNVYEEEAFYIQNTIWFLEELATAKEFIRLDVTEHL